MKEFRSTPLGTLPDAQKIFLMLKRSKRSNFTQDRDPRGFHNVGYRAFLLEEAENLLIPNFEARNVKIGGKEALIVLVDGDKEQLENFLKFVREDVPPKAVVEEIKVEEYDGRVRGIDIFRTSFDSAQLSKIVQVGLLMVEKRTQC